MTVLTLWGFIPQHVPGDLHLTPITSRLCNWCSLICVILAVACHLFAEYDTTRPPVSNEDPSMLLFLRFTATLAFGGLLYESCLAICICAMGLQTLYQEDLTFRRRLRLNRKMMFVFAFLTVTYLLMALNLQWVHDGWIAGYYGGHQIVYSVRYIEWVICAPFVLSISGQLDHAPDGSPRNGLIPSSLLTGIYCIISWQGLVVKDWWWAFILISFAFLSYFVCCVEQVAFAWWVKDQGRAGPVRAALLLYLVVMIGIYGVVYLLPIGGFISATLENKFYCLGDASFKLGTSVMLLATNDLANNEEMRRRAEATADELERLLHTASVPIFGVDCEGRINLWNMKTAELTGVPKERVFGLHLLPMLGEGSQVAGQSLLQRALDGEETDTLETTLNPRASEELLVSCGGAPMEIKRAMLILSIAPRRDRCGNVKGLCFVGCDLTEVTAFREAEDRKVRFMAVVSHELRSPLHGIIGLMDHLCDGEHEASKLRFMKLVKNCATRLLDLVVNIMEMASFASSNTGHQPPKRLSRDPVELTKILDEIVMLVKSSADKQGNPLVKKNVDIVNNLKTLPIIEADAYKCTQVFYNIVTNACKFTMKGSIVLDGKADPDGQWVEVSVSDTGKGIARSSIERIFHPFEQEDNSAVRGYQGIGLGLSIAHEVVKRHGGHIVVQSELDVGTTFTVRLPIVMAEPVAMMKVGTAESDNFSPVDNGMSALEDAGLQMTPNCEASRRGVILSVDDDAVNQEVLKGILTDHEVHIAMDGFEAIEFLRTCDVLPDVILLDVMMPGMSGFEVCRHIRQVLKIPETMMPILMLSASTQDASIIEAFDSGANDYVTKPFHKQVLNAHVRAAVRLKFQLDKTLDSVGSHPCVFRSRPEGADIADNCLSELRRRRQ